MEFDKKMGHDFEQQKKLIFLSIRTDFGVVGEDTLIYEVKIFIPWFIDALQLRKKVSFHKNMENIFWVFAILFSN